VGGLLAQIGQTCFVFLLFGGLLRRNKLLVGDESRCNRRRGVGLGVEVTLAHPHDGILALKEGSAPKHTHRCGAEFQWCPPWPCASSSTMSIARPGSSPAWT